MHAYKLCKREIMREVPIMSYIFDVVEESRALPNSRTIFDREIKIERDVTYKSVDGVDIKMDIYYPAKPVAKKSPCVMDIPGGGWMIKNRHRRDGYARCYAALGAVVFVIDHRYCPQVSFPTNLVDCIDAYNFICDNQDRFGVDANNIAITGDSSGGHLAACMGIASYSEEYRTKLSLPALQTKPANLIFISGAFSFDVMHRIPFTHLLMVRYVSNTPTRKAFRNWQYYKEINVYDYIDKDFPESYNNGGMTDFLCAGEAKRFSKVLDSKGVKNAYRVGKNIFNSGHCYVLRFPFAPARRDMLALYEWYASKQLEKGIDMSDNLKEVRYFFTNYKKALKEYNAQ